jgi:hypothetical protein
MTGKVINENPAIYLILILPIAAAIILIYEAWLYLLSGLAAVIIWKMWDNYQWRQWCGQMNPIFNQLIRDNQGCLTTTDLSLRGNLSGSSARRFLERKAQEYGAYRRQLQDQTAVYYFITASTLGTIFDTSELPEGKPEMGCLPSSASAAVVFNTPSAAPPTAAVPPPVASPSPTSHETPNALSKLAHIKEAQHKETLPEAIASEPEPIVSQSPAIEGTNEIGESVPTSTLKLIQADLAKRLDTTSSTIARRKSESDFPLWSQSKDPDGIPWQYIDEEKIFVAQIP